MKITWINFLSSTRDFLAKRLLIAAGACLALGLLTTPPVHAQVIHGTAGFETGMQLLAGGIQAPRNASDTDSGVTVDWGDQSTTAGLVQAVPSGFGGLGVTYNVYGTHLYEQAGAYAVKISYQYCSPICVPNPFNGQTLGLNSATVNTTATITAPGNFVILSIGDSIASGEGNPSVPNNPPGTITKQGNLPNWSFWDDGYSSGDNRTYSTPGQEFTCSFIFGICHIPVFPFICGFPIGVINGSTCTLTGPASPFPPDEQAEWPGQAFPCHRSSYAGTAQAANKLIQDNPPVANNPGSGITFINFACSGATIEPGATASTWTQDAVGQLKIARQRLAKFGAGIDILLISAGVDDLYGPTTFRNGFGGLLTYCLNLDPTNFHDHCDINNPMQSELTNSLSQLPGSYKNLAMEINCQQPPTGANGVQQDPDPSCTNPQKQIPKLVLITEYMDPSHDETGNYPSPSLGRAKCPPAFQNLDFENDGGDFKFFHDGVVIPLNNQVNLFPTYAQQAGLNVPTYAVTGIADDFLDHGVCAGGQRWVNSGYDSITLLGNGPPPNGTYQGQSVNLTIPAIPGIGSILGIGSISIADTEQLNGMLHPNTATLAATLPNLSSLGLGLLPGLFWTQCTACGQEDYRDRIFQAIVNDNPPVTTATTTNGVGGAVVVTVTASNAISEAGVGSTFYAVDNANCSPGSTSNCTEVTAPFTFTISTSGQHTVTFFSSNAGNYFEAPQSVQVSVNNNNNSLTITANNVTRQYGAADPTLEVSYGGFQNGDTPSVLTGTLTCTSTDTPTSAVGTYSINCSGLSSSTYNITYVPGTLTVTPAPLMITPNNATMQYGQANPAFTGTIAGLQNGDNITANYSTSATPASSVGNYAITPTLVDQSGKLGNYAVTVNSGLLTVTAAPLMVTASNASRPYGQANPAFTGTIAGLQNGDNITANYSTSATPASPVGNYAITPTLVDQSGKLGNYAVTLNNGTLAVTAVPLTVTVTNASRPYGQANPAFTGTIAGLQNGDNITANYSTSATPASSVGSYAITPTLVDQSGKLGNYAVTLNNATLTVTPAVVSILANNATKVLNAVNPAFTWTASGFVNGETTSVLTSNPACNTTAATNSPVGSYPITCSGATASNYTFSYASGTLKIQYATTVGHIIQPPINSDGTSVFNQGRTLPAKFSVYDANGVSIGAPGVVSMFYLTGILSGTTTAAVEDVVDTNNPDTSFRWDSTSQQWIFNIATSNLTAGSTYVYAITLNDGTVINFQFGLR